MKKIVQLLLILVGTTTLLFAASDIYTDISNAIRSGDAKAVSKYFGNTVNMTIVSQEDMYSKVQAEQVLRDFFSKNTPKSFNIIHKGVSKEGAKFAIGTLQTAQGASFRTYFFVKQSTAGEIIQELRFERE